MTRTFYLFADGDTARAAHAAIDDARLDGADRHWPDGVTERHTMLERDGENWLILATDFTEELRADRRVALPDPVEVDFDTGAKDELGEPVMRSIEKVNPKRSDVLAARRST